LWLCAVDCVLEEKGLKKDNEEGVKMYEDYIKQRKIFIYNSVKVVDDDVIKFIAEPGRYFVEKSHILVLNVIGKKREQYTNKSTGELEDIIIYYLNDGVYGSFNCIYYDHNNPIIQPFNERNEKVLYKSKIFGPTCDSMDLIAKEIMLPELVVGEWVYVENFGAYTTAASSSFNGFITTDYKYILRN
jgi:ornithine decarboxylase